MNQQSSKRREYTTSLQRSLARAVASSILAVAGAVYLTFRAIFKILSLIARL